MRPFEYRQPRQITNFGLDFYVDGTIVHGVSSDVSNGGLSARFDGDLNLGDTGSLVIRHPKRHFTLGAVVAHLEEDHVGLKFTCKTREERSLVEELSSYVIGQRTSA